jgi:multicomponent Na+:H+ antiporter subunit C
VTDLLLDRYVYFLVVVLLSVGLYGMLAMRNLMKKIIGMVIFQTAIYLFFIEGSVKRGASAPIVDRTGAAVAADHVNPLPHLLILTAIVVGVGVVGVAFALLSRIHEAHGTLDEQKVLEDLSGGADRAEVHQPGDGPSEGDRWT